MVIEIINFLKDFMIFWNLIFSNDLLMTFLSSSSTCEATKQTSTKLFDCVWFVLYKWSPLVTLKIYDLRKQ